MRRQVVRAVMAVIGIISFAVYAGVAYLAYLLLQYLWVDRPSAAVSVAVLVGFSLGIGYLSYRFGTERLLQSIDARPVTPEWEPRFFRMLDRLCNRMGVGRPRVYVSNLGEPNAFAMSTPRGGVIVLDRALVSLLTAAELEAVVAHELAHLESHDSLVQLVAFTGLQTVVQLVMLALFPGLLLFTGFAKAIAWFRGQPGRWTQTVAWKLRTIVLAFVMLAPVVVTFVLFVHSRRREYAADRKAAEATGNPLALARALRKIDDAARADINLRSMLPEEEQQEPDPIARLLATHPATDDRIERLRRLAEESRISA